MYPQKATRIKGFSLIELLVVITIIGLLISLVYVNFVESRQRTRDQIRQTTLRDIELALEQYKAQNGRYPQPGCTDPNPQVQWFTNQNPGARNLIRQYAGGTVIDRVCNRDFINGLVPDYIASLPADGAYFYRTDVDGTRFKLVTVNTVESRRLASQDEAFSACPSTCPAATEPYDLPLCNTYQSLPGWQTSYAVYSLGAECW